MARTCGSGLPASCAARLAGSITFSFVSAGTLTLVITPCANRAARAADLGPPAAIQIGTGPIGGLYSLARSVR